MDAASSSGSFSVIKVLSNEGVFTPRAFPACVSYAGSIYLLGGCSGAACSVIHQEILTSGNGAMCNQVIGVGCQDKPTGLLWSSSFFQNCARLMAVVHEESIYVIGGRSGLETRVVCMSSHPAGASLLSIQALPPVPSEMTGFGRQQSSLVTLLGKLWVLGGKNDEGWRGKDLLVLLTNADSAKHWALVDPVTPFPGRYAGSGVVVRGRMCVMGGVSVESGGVLGDVCCAIRPAFPPPAFTFQAPISGGNCNGQHTATADLSYPAYIYVCVRNLPRKPESRYTGTSTACTDTSLNPSPLCTDLSPALLILDVSSVEQGSREEGRKEVYAYGMWYEQQRRQDSSFANSRSIALVLLPRPPLFVKPFQ